MIRISVTTKNRKEAVEITGKVESLVKNTKEGIIVLYVPHTTAGIVVNESYDPDVARDIMNKLSELIPHGDRYRHVEGNADAHIQSSIVGSSVTLIVKDGKLEMGRWQGVFFLEFDGPRHREVWAKILEG